MDAARREKWLAGLETSHGEVLPMLRQMLETHDRAERENQLEAGPNVGDLPLRVSQFSAGTRVGPFQLLRLLGYGGMGEVWLAAQVDGRMEREVALKLPTTQQHGENWRERFRRERDILAKLTHPNIARLYDAGISEEEGSRGQPYMAMEYVEGEPLDAYATLHRLSIAARLALFRQILAAVSHAHRHLVVHRDLKPANILIDRSGQVKLLDFGIAKLIDDEFAANTTAALTQLGARMLTLRYAAPEQIAAGAISTATDVYALGVILYELMTGASPYRAVRDGKGLTETVLLAEQPTMPSSLASARACEAAASERGFGSAGALSRVLSGDIDAIILKALRRNPADRYITIDQFDDDIARHLTKRPVKARTGTWRYLAGRYVARHKLSFATAAAVIVTMAVGLVMVESQRRVAVAERERAQRHFASVRDLANTFMFDVHGELENLPGSLKARQTLVATSLKYLDSLAGEAVNDPALGLEVAVAYRKLAEIKGDSRGAHLGESGTALSNARRAAGLLDSVLAREPDNIAALRERRQLGLLLGRMILEGGDANGIRETERAVQAAEKITTLPGAELADRRNLGAALAEYGGILAVVKADEAGADVQLKRATGYLEALVRDNPADVLSRARLAYAYERGAMAAEVSGKPERLPQALELFGKSIATTESVRRDEPANLSHATTLVKRYNNASRAALKAGDTKQAAALAGRGLELVRSLAAADRQNIGNQTMLVSVLATSADIAHKAGGYDKSIALARDAIAVDAGLPEQTRAGLIVRESLAGAWRTLGASQCALAATPAGAARKAALLLEGRTFLGQSRAFKQELVDRKIDAVDASAAIEEIDHELQRCSEVFGGKLVR